MWLSKMLSKSSENTKAESGFVTMADDGKLEASASMSERGINVYAPYGIHSVPPENEEVFLVPSSSGQAALGVKGVSVGIASGEVLITSLGGAKIYLKNDGSVVINDHFVIDREGRAHDQ